MSMYEIINKIRKKCPEFCMVQDKNREKRDDCNQLLDELFGFTDKLNEYFPSIDTNTYCMIVCGTIMQIFMAKLADYSDFEEDYFDKLKSPLATTETIEYFKHIFNAIEYIPVFHYFNADKEITEWPTDFFITLEDDNNEVRKYFQEELLRAIDICEDYSFAYCLLMVPYINATGLLDFNFKTVDGNLRKAVATCHKYMGEELFKFCFWGNFLDKHLVYTRLTFTPDEIEEGEKFFREEISEYAQLKGFDFETIRHAEITNGYYYIEGGMFPAGIPFHYTFTYETFDSLVKDMFEYLPSENTGVYHLQNSEQLLTNHGSFSIEIKNNALYQGLCYFMPLYGVLSEHDSVWRKLYYQDCMYNTLGELLDVSADEMEHLAKANEELRTTNEDLNLHLALNKEMLMSISHASSNYLNTERLKKIGKELQQAVENSPTLESIHTAGILLFLQAEQELFLRRRLDSLVIRCSHNRKELEESIRRGLSSEEGESIQSPLTFATRTIISRIVTRDDDIRSIAIRNKFHKSDEEWKELKEMFISEVLANGESAYEWCNRKLCTINSVVQGRWSDIKIIENRFFFDLIVEILTEQLLNALSHGDITKGISIVFGESDFTKFKGKPKPNWFFIRTVNAIGEQYKGGEQKGISTLNSTLLLLNEKQRGFDYKSDSKYYTATAWLERELLVAL